jgi:hypothetical protein
MSGAGFDNRSIRILVIIYLILDFPAGQVNSFCCFNLTGRTGKFIGQEILFKGFSGLEIFHGLVDYRFAFITTFPHF